MKRSTLFSTAAVLALSTTLALAEGAQREQRQEPSNAPSNAPAAQQQAPQRAQDSASPSSPGTSRQPSANQSSQSAPSGSTNQPSQAQQQPANQNAQREPRQAEPNNKPAEPNNQRAQQPSQQNNTNAQREQSNQPARNNAQTNQQPSQRSTQAPQSGQAKQSAQITTEQRTKIASTIRQQNVSPVKVNFAVNVGVNVPSSVHLSVLPDTIVSIVPQYRGYSYFVTDEQIVIVEPSSHRIVEVMAYEGGGRAAAAPARSERKVQFSKEQRESIRKHAATKRTVTTGSGSTKRIVVEDEVPSTVVLEEFPETVVREVPSVRTYRYYRQDNDLVVVDPGSRRVIDVIE